MTTTYDPFHPNYLDGDDLRQEMDRVYDLCHGCRLCFKYCTSFPTLFKAVDQHDDQNVAALTDAERFQVVDECFSCKLCYVNCPYTPGQHEWQLDFPRLMLRAKQVRNQGKGLAERIADQALGRTDLVGAVASATAPLANKVIESPSSPGRKVMEKVLGISAERILSPYRRERFSTWFRKRPPFVPAAEVKQGDALIFTTCQIEYSQTGIGKDFVKIAERNKISCSLPEGQQCCGAPFLHEGSIDEFRKAGRKNVRALAGAIRAKLVGGEQPTVVVAQPTCGYVLKFDYVDYLEGDDRIDAELVSEHTQDAGEFLMNVHKADDTALDMTFPGDVPEKVTYHAPCHLRAQSVGLKSRDLLNLTGAKATVVAECSGIDGSWGLRETNVQIARGVAKKLIAAVEKNQDASGEAAPVVGDCTLANGGITLETGATPVHPLQFMARAYGIPEES